MSGLVLCSLGPGKRMAYTGMNDETTAGDRGGGRNQGRPLHIIIYRAEAIRSQKGF